MATAARMLVPVCSGLGDEEEKWSSFRLEAKTIARACRGMKRRNEDERSLEQWERGYLAAADEGALAVSDPPGEGDGRREVAEGARGSSDGRSGGWAVCKQVCE